MLESTSDKIINIFLVHNIRSYSVEQRKGNWASLLSILECSGFAHKTLNQFTFTMPADQFQRGFKTHFVCYRVSPESSGQTG